MGLATLFVPLIRVMFAPFSWLATNARKLATSKFWGYTKSTQFKLVKALVLGVCLNGVDVLTDIYSGVILML